MTTSTLPSLSPLRAIERHARYRSHQAAILGGRDVVTYGELWRRTEEAARTLGEAGATPGATVTLAMEPGVDHLAAILGVLLLGGVAAPLNPRLTATEADELIGSLRPSLLVASASHTSIFEGRAGAEALPIGGHPVVARRVEGTAWMDAAVPGEQPALILCTGGTTGTPKGATFSHRALWLWTASTATHNHVRSADTELYVAPFFHGTLVTGLLTTLVVGGTVHIAPRFDAEEAADLLASGETTRVLGAATVIDRLVAAARVRDMSASRLRFVQFGMSSSRSGLTEEIRAALPGVEVITGYGATEYGPVTRTYSWEFDAAGDPVGVGRPVAGADLRVLVDGVVHDGPGIEGEIIVNAPWQMMSYRTVDPELESAVRHGRHLRSGDIGRFDDEGHLLLTGRLKDTIRTGGENVYPTEVETVLHRHPAVVDCAVFAVSDADWGERVEAVVVATYPDLGVDVLDAHLRGQLAGFKVPKRIRFVEELPMTANHKVDRRALRQAAEDATEPGPVR